MSPVLLLNPFYLRSQGGSPSSLLRPLDTALISCPFLGATGLLDTPPLYTLSLLGLKWSHFIDLDDRLGKDGTCLEERVLPCMINTTLSCRLVVGGVYLLLSGI